MVSSSHYWRVVVVPDRNVPGSGSLFRGTAAVRRLLFCRSAHAKCKGQDSIQSRLVHPFASKAWHFSWLSSFMQGASTGGHVLAAAAPNKTRQINNKERLCVIVIIITIVSIMLNQWWWQDRGVGRQRLRETTSINQTNKKLTKEKAREDRIAAF